MAGLVVAGLVAAVGYLLSEINRGRYRLAVEGEELIVQRGAYLPIGFTRFEPESEDLQRSYAPLELPDARPVSTAEVYDDRADLDRALFAILAGWSRELLESDAADDFELAMSYVARAELLPGLSEEQRFEMRALRADTAFQNGRRILSQVEEQLDAALDSFGLALELGTTRQAAARRWMAEIRRRLELHRAGRDRVDDLDREDGASEEVEPPGLESYRRSPARRRIEPDADDDRSEPRDQRPRDESDEEPAPPKWRL